MSKRESVGHLVKETVCSPEFRRATFGGAVRGGQPTEWVRVTIRSVTLRSEPHVQFAYFDGKQTNTKNFAANALETPLNELLAVGFAGIHLETATEEIDIRT